MSTKREIENWIDGAPTYGRTKWRKNKHARLTPECSQAPQWVVNFVA